MAYKMKGHTLPGINQRSSEKVDLTKKTGLGPRAEVKKLKEDKGPTEIEMQNTGDFNISNLHKDTKISLDKKKEKERVNKGKTKDFNEMSKDPNYKWGKK